MRPIRPAPALLAIGAVAAVVAGCGMTQSPSSSSSSSTTAAATMPPTMASKTTQLSAANEVPPNNSTATGQATVTFNTSTKVLSWNVSYRGTTGPITGAHIHGPAGAGANAGVVVPFTPPLTSPITGSATLTDAQIAQLMAGQWYVNLHTAAHPGGEIRGQLR